MYCYTRVCRFCKKSDIDLVDVTTNFNRIVDRILRCLLENKNPELNVHLKRVCRECFQTLDSLIQLDSLCSQTDRTFLDYLGQLRLRRVLDAKCDVGDERCPDETCTIHEGLRERFGTVVGRVKNESQDASEDNREIVTIKQEFVELKDEYIERTENLRTEEQHETASVDQDPLSVHSRCEGYDFKVEMKVCDPNGTNGKNNFRDFVCDICNKKFMNRITLIRHERVHSEEQPFICKICTKSYKYKQNLDIHLLTHTGEQPFICNICNRGFREKSNLNQHQRVHTGERPYVCDVCNKAFTQKHVLNDHKYTHTGERPYVCKVCSRTFSFKTNLLQHHKVHVQEPVFVCDKCNKGFNQKISLKRHKCKVN